MASSWSNPRHAAVLGALREAGFEVYDYRHPPAEGAVFAWPDLIPVGEWSPARFREALKEPLAERGFGADFAGMRWADACVLVLGPSAGRSSHLEAGIMKGWGKFVALLFPEDGGGPDLTYKALDAVCLDTAEVVAALARFRAERDAQRADRALGDGE